MIDAAQTSGMPETLDQAGIRLRIPHAGRMCLLDHLLSWTPEGLCCTLADPAAPDHPMRTAGGLLAPTAIECAAQAMALHASLCAGDGAAPTPGFLASARGVQMHVQRLDDAPGPLQVRAQLQSGSTQQALYRFAVHDARDTLLVEGRATVVLNQPLLVPSP